MDEIPLDEILHDGLAASSTKLSPKVAKIATTEISSKSNTKSRGRHTGEKPASPPAKQAVPQESKVEFRFLLSNHSSCSVVQDASDFETARAFCEAAQAAWMLSDTKTRRQEISACIVSWDGCKQSLVVPWGDSKAYEKMMSYVAEGKVNTKGFIEAEVRCLEKKVPT